MLTEWFKAMAIFVRKGYQAITKNVNNEPYSQKSIWLYHIFFVVISLVCVILLPKGIDSEFIDYIKDIFAIFIGFFVTALTMIYDKLDVTKVPSHEEIDRMLADKRPSAKDIHNMYLQPIITQYFIDNKSEIWLLFLIAHSKR